MIISVDILVQWGKSHGIPTLEKEQQATNEYLDMKNLLGMSLLIGSLVPSGQPCNHLHTSNSNHTLQIVFIYLCTYCI